MLINHDGCFWYKLLSNIQTKLKLYFIQWSLSWIVKKLLWIVFPLPIYKCPVASICWYLWAHSCFPPLNKCEDFASSRFTCKRNIKLDLDKNTTPQFLTLRLSVKEARIICCMRIMVPIRSSEYGPLDRSVQFLSSSPSPDSDQQQLQVQQLHTGPDWRKSVSAMHSSLLFSLSQHWHFTFLFTFTVMIFNF